MTKATEREIIREDHAKGGEGYILKEPFLGQEELGENCRLFSRMTLPAGCGLGYHEQ